MSAWHETPLFDLPASETVIVPPRFPVMVTVAGEVLPASVMGAMGLAGLLGEASAQTAADPGAVSGCGDVVADAPRVTERMKAAYVSLDAGPSPWCGIPVEVVTRSRVLAVLPRETFQGQRGPLWLASINDAGGTCCAFELATPLEVWGPLSWDDVAALSASASRGVAAYMGALSLDGLLRAGCAL